MRWRALHVVEKVGKTSIIEVLITETFEENVQPVLPVLVVPKEVTPERVHVSIVDTPGQLDQVDKVDAELAVADVIVLVYSVEGDESTDRVAKYWLPKFRAASLKVPVILVGNKIDTRGGISDPGAAAKMEAFIKPIMDNFREVDVCIECSAKTVSNISEVFYFAQKAVLHPTGPLYDVDTHSLKPRAAAALRRIFKMCDKDCDGGLNDSELNDFQYACFNVHLKADELAGVKNVVQENRPKDGLNRDGSLSSEGFLYLHTLFVQKGRLETTWIVLRKFGYDDNMRLSVDASMKIERSDDQSVELSVKGRQFLAKAFAAADKDADGLLSPAELASVFADCPDGAFALSNDTGPRLTSPSDDGRADYMTLDAFMARWSMLVMDSVDDAMLNIMYLGYTETPQTAFKVTKPRKRDRAAKTVSREVFNVLVLGSEGALKADIIRGLVKLEPLGLDAPGIGAAAEMIAPGGESSRTLVMRDVAETQMKALFGSKAALEAVDVMCVVFDASSQESYAKARLIYQALQVKKSAVKVPMVFVASVSDEKSAAPVLELADAFCVEASLPTPVRVSSQEGEDGNLYQDLLGVALYPQVACVDYYGGSGEGSSGMSTALKVAAGGIAIGATAYGVKCLYDYYMSQPRAS